jgi:ArsR family transcriptional regulator
MKSRLAGLESVFKALADRTRLRIVGLLLSGEVCVCHIHEALKISQPKASRHLAYLRKTGLVETRRDGLWIHYRMADRAEPVLQTIQRTVGHALRQLDLIRKDAERLRKLRDERPAGANRANSGQLHAPELFAPRNSRCCDQPSVR